MLAGRPPCVRIWPCTGSPYSPSKASPVRARDPLTGLRQRPGRGREPALRADRLHRRRAARDQRRGLHGRRLGGSRSPRRGRHRDHHAHARHGRACARRAPAAGADRRARRDQARHPAGLPLHRLLRPRRRRAARRPARHHALAARARVPAGLPARPARRGGPLRGRRRHPHLGGRGRRCRPLPLHDPPGPGFRRRQPRRAAVRGPAVARRRPGPVHRPARPRTHRRHHHRHPGLGSGTPRRADHSHRARRSRPDEPAYFHPAVPRGGRHDPGAVAHRATPGGRPPVAGILRPPGRPRRPPGGFGSANSLRQHMRTSLGVSPIAYRRTFRPAAAA